MLDKLRIYGPARFASFARSELRYRLKCFLRHSYSQLDEDLVADRLLGRKDSGFYVDVGANDPSRFNNTMRFYQRGWRGISIEPNQKCFSRLDKKRPLDINLNIGVSDTSGTLEFYRFFPDTLSTFSKSEADRYVKLGYTLADAREITVTTLADIALMYIRDRPVDILSVDTEGRDLEVLKGNDWATFMPRVIIIESAKHESAGDKASGFDRVEALLAEVGYKKVHDNGLNSIFITS